MDLVVTQILITNNMGTHFHSVYGTVAISKCCHAAVWLEDDDDRYYEVCYKCNNYLDRDTEVLSIKELHQ